MRTLAADVRDAARTLWKAPRFLIVAAFTLAMDIGVLLATSLLAAYLPARRAAAVSPIEAMRAA